MTSRTATRVTFTLIVVFLIAQMAWWIIFQTRYIGQVIDDTLAAWQRDQRAANAVLEAYPDDDTLVSEMLAEFSHLRFDEGSGQLVVDPAVEAEFLASQRSYSRMFLFEGPFFVLIVLFGLLIIGRSLRQERELKRRQRNFLDAVGHEFRTPVSTLRLLIETALMRELTPEKQRHYLNRMAAEVDRLEHTGLQVLASARLESSSPPLDGLAQLDLRDAVRRVVELSRLGLEARGARLSVDYGDTELPVAVEPEGFKVLLDNLLDNAVKYTPEASKPVALRLERSGGNALLHVEDRGRGIPERERNQVFERFYRGGNELTRTAPGIGLGLYLVERAATRMHGSVTITANEAQGTRFTVALPLVTATSQSTAAAAVTA
ncbi:MAG TPA: HAMP domain-containing sensor histidine kinase [Trueperaceae bacterium]|nr:HAMP domain-containing sensor histidine kinase [Trueperaceae bacterium]